MSQTKKNDAKKGKVAQKEVETLDNLPLWDFDDEHDVATIMGQTIFECILGGASVSMSSYINMVDNCNSDLTKSDLTVLISASILQRLGMSQESSNMLALSDQVDRLYKNMNLTDKSNNNMFSTMIMILCPEVIKQIEMAMITAISKNTRRTKAPHTESRLVTAMKSITLSDDTLPNDLNIAQQAAMSNSSKLLMDIPVDFVSKRTETSDDVEPAESISNRNSNANKNLSTNDIMKFIRENKSVNNTAKAFDSKFDPLKKPVSLVTKKDKTGLGYPVDRITTLQNATASSSKKMDSLQKDLLNMLQVEEETLSESSEGLI